MNSASSVYLGGAVKVFCVGFFVDFWLVGVTFFGFWLCWWVCLFLFWGLFLFGLVDTTIVWGCVVVVSSFFVVVLRPFF
jgi:hypothetical protein